MQTPTDKIKEEIMKEQIMKAKKDFNKVRIYYDKEGHPFNIDSVYDLFEYGYLLGLEAVLKYIK